MKRTSKLVNIKKAFTRNQIFCITCTSVAFIAVGICVYRNNCNLIDYKESLEAQAAFYDNAGELICELREIEYEISMINAGIEAKHLTVEQNIDTSYRILLGKSSRTTNDELIEVISQRVPTIRETMNTGDLHQAIEVMKENFPAATFAELDNLYEKNVKLLSEITTDKIKYNQLVAEYNQRVMDNKDVFDALGFTEYTFEEYIVDDEMKDPVPQDSPEVETEPETDENGAVG